ncbi:hypothetical protein PhCBS80983_g02630 [Powellomyces hirtus]|uniref:GDS1 winged helix domain-containing protein n=1 Tax=Powellomyces hirtus TaxID=109895 RepID=A0A507E519_9FUNG|nr:hypothetical protein PhCBS80983_g02630 [Powellomyces hirtus]
MEKTPATSPAADERPEVNVNVHPDDHRDKVFMAVMSALIMGGNRPCSPKELAAFILKHKLATLGGQTPYATVSSRISQHFKRCAEGSRKPLLAKQAVIEPNRKATGATPRKWRYYVDQEGVPVADDVGPVSEPVSVVKRQEDVAMSNRRGRGGEKEGSLAVGKTPPTTRTRNAPANGRRRSAPESPPPSVSSSSKSSSVQEENEEGAAPSTKRTRNSHQEPSPNSEQRTHEPEASSSTSSTSSSNPESDAPSARPTRQAKNTRNIPPLPRKRVPEPAPATAASTLARSKRTKQ